MDRYLADIDPRADEIYTTVLRRLSAWDKANLGEYRATNDADLPADIRPEHIARLSKR